jgi:hypothetical protein
MKLPFPALSGGIKYRYRSFPRLVFLKAETFTATAVSIQNTGMTFDLKYNHKTEPIRVHPWP